MALPFRIVRSVIAATLVLAACSSPPDGDGDKADSAGIEEGSCDAVRILAVVNQASLSELDKSVKLDRRAAENIVAARMKGEIESLAQLDAIAFVGESAFAKLLAHARKQGDALATCEPAGTLIEVPLLDEEESLSMVRFNDKIVAAGLAPLPERAPIDGSKAWDEVLARTSSLAETLGIPNVRGFFDGPGDAPGTCYRGAPEEVADLTSVLTDSVFSDMYFVIAWRAGERVEFEDEELAEALLEEFPEFADFDGKTDDVLILHGVGDDSAAVARVPRCAP